jgi:hypothetical protein
MQYKDDPEALESWQGELCKLARSSKVDKDITLTTGSKLAKFISRKKKALMAEMSHMSTFDVHCVTFIMCGRPDAYAAHAQNAILCSSAEIEQLAEQEFDLKKSLNELFVKVLRQRLDTSGLSKWHQETEKKHQEQELRTRDSAYSAASKHLKNLFVSNGHTWFPVTVPWVRLLALLRQHRVRIVGWPLESECPAPHPSRTNKSWEGGQWRTLVTEFHKGGDCQIKVEKWDEDTADDDDDAPLVIDCNDNVIRRARDAEHGAKPTSHSKRKSSKSTRIVSAPTVPDSDSDDPGLDIGGSNSLVGTDSRLSANGLGFGTANQILAGPNSSSAPALAPTTLIPKSPAPSLIPRSPAPSLIPQSPAPSLIPQSPAPTFDPFDLNQFDFTTLSAGALEELSSLLEQYNSAMQS